MRALHRQWLIVIFVGLLVALAGCGGGGDGDGAAPTTTISTQTSTSPTATDGSTDDPPTTAGEMTTARPTTTSSGPPSFDPAAHREAITEAGSYTVEFSMESTATTTGSITGIQETDVETGELYMRLDTSSDGQTTTLEYYRPPNSDTLYQHFAGQTREVSGVTGFGYNFTDPGTGAAAGDWPAFTHTGTGTTALGPATTYTVDSVEDLPEETLDQYENVTAVQFKIWVDQDTGIVAKYDYEVTFIEDGEEQTLEVTFEITEVGSTEVEEPDWVP
jgi:hypothetical protein